MNPEDNKVTMLLNIDSFYGESEGRLGPVIKMLCIGLAPILIQTWLGFPVPTLLFITFQIIWFIRVAMITVGREKQRLEQFRKQLNDDYSSISELLCIKAIHPDGCVEYTNGRVAYFLVAANGTFYDSLAHSKNVREFLSQFGADLDIDIYIQNITELKSLEERYSNVTLFTDEDAAKDFIDIIDHNRGVVYSESRLVRVVFGIKGRRSQWTEIRDYCKQACYSTAARAFKDIHIASPDEVQELVDTDIRGYVDINGTLQRKYATHNYHGSRVLYFGEQPIIEEEPGEDEERGFIVDDE